MRVLSELCFTLVDIEIMIELFSECPCIDFVIDEDYIND